MFGELLVTAFFVMVVDANAVNGWERWGLTGGWGIWGLTGGWTGGSWFSQ